MPTLRANISGEEHDKKSENGVGNYEESSIYIVPKYHERWSTNG